MCGIVGFAGDRDVTQFILKGLSSLEYRGYDSAGVALLSEGRIKTEKTALRITELINRAQYRKGLFGNIGIGHTRWATHGAATEENAHPHISFDRKFAVVHNGIIENYETLKRELLDKGIDFQSETDTEVIPHLLALYYEGDLLSAVENTISCLSGSYALCIICTDFPDRIIAVKKDSPLVLGKSEVGSIIASDILAIVPHTRQVYYPEDGEIADITKDGITFYKNRQRAEKQSEEISWEIGSAEKGAFKHYMLKEIYEQPKMAEYILSKHIKDRKVVFQHPLFSVQELKDIHRIHIVACGSAYHAGMVGKYILEPLLKIPVEVEIASEFRYRRPLIKEGSLVILISQSGETADTLAALNEAKRLGSKTLALVNVLGSAIAKAADHIIYTDAGPEIAVATTKGYTSQIICLGLFGIWAGERISSLSEKEVIKATEDLLSLPQTMDKCLSMKNTVKELAKRSCYINSIFFIGRNIDHAVALEASLKLKEISYIHCEAYAAGELKHGSIALIEQGTTVIAINCFEPLHDKVISNIKEVKARGAFVVALCREGDTTTAQAADEVIFMPKTKTVADAAAEIIPFQLYAYFVAAEKGLDVDKPRNLAKSVTVE